MKTILEIIIGICGLIYFMVGFIYFLTANNYLYRFLAWIEKEIKRLTSIN